MDPFCKNIGTKYEFLVKIGQGTFGSVYKARDKVTQRIVAVKKVLTDNTSEGMPITSIREIQILQLLKHKNIVSLLEICTDRAERGKLPQFFLIFEFCEHDLAGLLSNNSIKFSQGQLKTIMWQLLNALYFTHGKNIIHRDVKTANILVTQSGILKLADFGLARTMSSLKGDNHRFTNRVVTLWYRPPELLLGERNYGTAIDIWGAGCIMAELWIRTPLMKGNNEQHQLNLIIDFCGSINPSSYPGVEKLDLYNKLELKQGVERKIIRRLRPYVKENDALDLLDKLLTINPAERIDSDTALSHNMFYNDVLREELKLDCQRSNFEMFTQRNPVQARQAVLHPVPRRPEVEEYRTRVF